MQIHEIFNRKPTNESVLGQLASAASQKVLGTDVFDKTGQDIARGPEAEQRARAASKSMITTQAATNQKLWNQAVADMMKRAGVGSADQLDAASRQSLIINLTNQLNQNFLQDKIKDYKQLATAVEVPKPPSQTPPATEVVPEIQAAMDQIASLRNINNPQASTADWQKLATAAYDAMALLQFHPKGSAATAQNVVSDPRTDAVLKATGMDADTLTKLNAAVRQGSGGAVKATGNSTIDGILKAARLL
jgi:hypothetical protein